MINFLFSWYNLPFLALIYLLFFYHLLHNLELQDDFDSGGWDSLTIKKKAWVNSYWLSHLNPYGFPSIMMIVPLILSTSILGLVCNYYLIWLDGWMPISWALLVCSAFILSTGLTGLFLATINLVFPSTRFQSIRRVDLLGQFGVVVSSHINHKFGRVRVKLQPNIFTLSCQIESGQANIRKGTQVVLTSYNAEYHRFTVEVL